MYRLACYSKKSYTDLINKGCGINKSLILKFPVSHFIRGYFDGDGCV